MVDFVRLQQDAAQYLEDHEGNKRIATAWPFSEAIATPEFGYVHHPLNRAIWADGMRRADLAKLNPKDFDVLVLYSLVWPANTRLLAIRPIRTMLELFMDLNFNATSEEVRTTLGFVPVIRWTRGGQWIEIYLPDK